jgi:hypothetical protein
LHLIRGDAETAVMVGTKFFPEVSPQVIRMAIERLVQENVFPERAAISLDSWRSAISLRIQVGDLQPGDYDRLCVNRYAEQALAKQP